MLQDRDVLKCYAGMAPSAAVFSAGSFANLCRSAFPPRPGRG